MRIETALAAIVLVFGQTSIADEDRDSLRRLPGVYVEVNMQAGREADNLAVDEESLRTTVELRLRSVGVRILTKEEALRSRAAPWFTVAFVMQPVGEAETFAFATTYLATLDQRVVLSSGATAVGTTWMRSGVAFTGRTKVAEHLREIAAEVADKFANDFLAANPPRAPREAAGIASDVR